jgi:hypothetical protein
VQSERVGVKREREQRERVGVERERESSIDRSWTKRLRVRDSSIAKKIYIAITIQSVGISTINITEIRYNKIHTLINLVNGPQPQTHARKPLATENDHELTISVFITNNSENRITRVLILSIHHENERDVK